MDKSYCSETIEQKLKETTEESLDDESMAALALGKDLTHSKKFEPLFLHCGRSQNR